MSVPETLRRLYSGLVIVMILAVSLPTWADGEADQIANAQQLIDDKKYDDAVAILTPLTSSADPIGRQAKEALESCYRHAGQFDKAIPILESLARDYPANNAMWKALLGSAYRSMDDYPKSFAALKESLESESTPELLDAVTAALWITCATANDWAPAIPIYESLLTKRPQEAAIWKKQLSRCYRKTGKSKEAVAVLEREIELAKGDREAIKRIEPELTGAYADADEFGKITGLFQKIEAASPGYSIARAHELLDRNYAIAEAIVTPIAASKGQYASEARMLLEGCYRRAGQWEKALAILEARLLESPKDTAELKVLMGRCYRGMGEHTKALSTFKEGLDSTRSALVTTGLTMNLREWCAETQDWTSAASLYESVVTEHPKEAARWYLELSSCYRALKWNPQTADSIRNGLSSPTLTPEIKQAMLAGMREWCAEAKNWELAVPVLKSLLETVPKDSVEWHYQLGHCYLMMAKKPECIAAFEKALELSSGNLAVAKRIEPDLTDAYIDAKSFDKLIALFEKIEAAEPGYTIARAQALVAQGKFAVAEAIVSPVISANGPNAKQANVILEACYTGTQQWSKALPVLEARLRESPKDTAALKSLLGRCHRGLRDYPKALATFREGLEFTPRTPEVTVALTANLRKLVGDGGKWGDAVDLYRSLLTKQPAECARWYRELSRYYEKLQMDTEMADSIRLGLLSTTLTPDVKQGLIESVRNWCGATKNWEPAISVFQLMLEQHPAEATEWQYHLGYCNWRIATGPERVSVFDKALEAAKGDKAAIERIATSLAKGCGDGETCRDADTILKKLSAQYPRTDDFWKTQSRECKRSLANGIAYRAYRLIDSRDYVNAAVSFKEAIRYSSDLDDPRNAHVSYAECLNGQGKTDEALAYAKVIYEHEEWRDGALFVMGRISFDMQRYDDAATAFRRVVVEYPKSPYLQYCKPWLVTTLQKLGRIDEAVGTLRAMAREASDLKEKAANLLRVAETYGEVKMYHDAIRAFKEVRELKDASDEQKAEATYYSGLCYQEIRYYASARSCMEEVVKARPGSQWATKASGALYVWSNYGEHVRAR